MKNLLETTGDFQLLDFETGTLIRHEGVTLCASSNFVQTRLAMGQLKLHGQVNDAATDEEWQKYVADSDGNLDLAVAAFQSAYPLEPAVAEPEPPKASPKKSSAKKQE